VAVEYPYVADVFLASLRPENETDHSLPSTAAVKNVWNYTSTRPYVFVARYLIKNRDNFTFYLLSIKLISVISRSRDSSVGIALGYGLDDRGSRVRFPAGAGKFSLHHRI
jgi:hypothetical protein